MRSEVISIGEKDAAAHVGHLMVGDTFYAGLSAHRHVDWREYWTVR